MQVYVPFISPDGKRVAYGNGKGEIYVISMDAGPPEKIVEKDASAATWSPDGNVLVFTSARESGTHFELAFLDLRTGKRTVVPGSLDLLGGQWVAEQTLVATPRNQMKVMIFDVRKQQWSDLVSGKVPGSVVNWAHSPDYKYVSYTTGGAEPKAMRVRLADHKVENIANLKDLRRALGPDGNTQISVAPDGSAIFHSRRRHPGNLRPHAEMAVSRRHQVPLSSLKRLRSSQHPEQCYRVVRLRSYTTRGEELILGSKKRARRWTRPEGSVTANSLATIGECKDRERLWSELAVGDLHCLLAGQRAADQASDGTLVGFVEVDLRSMIASEAMSRQL